MILAATAMPTVERAAVTAASRIIASIRRHPFGLAWLLRAGPLAAGPKTALWIGNDSAAPSALDSSEPDVHYIDISSNK